MCGRTRCTLDPELVARATGVPPEKWIDKERYHPSYNLSPGHYTPILRNAKKPTDAPEAKEAKEGEPKAEENEPPPERIVQCMKWGLVPSFTKKEEKPDFFRMFNARGESIHERNAFRRLLPKSRCVAMVEGFYEWKKDEKSKAKQPYYLHYREEGRPLLFAALCDWWEDAEGNVLHTYTIVTTRVSKALEWLHDRMPVILGSQSEVDTWLQPDLPVEQVLKLAKPYELPDLVWHPVTSEMGKPSFDSPACIKEVTPTTAATSAIASLFKKASKPGHPAQTPSDSKPELDGPEDEKAFAAAVIPDRDVSTALGKRKDHPCEEEPKTSGDSGKASEKVEGASGASENSFGASGKAPETGGTASEPSGHASGTGANASGAGVIASGIAAGIRKGVEAVSEEVGAVSKTVKDASGAVGDVVKAGLGAATERLQDSVDATSTYSAKHGKDGVNDAPGRKPGAVGSTELHLASKDTTEKPVEAHGVRVEEGGWRSSKSGVQVSSPKSDSKQGKAKSDARPKGTSEPSPKKQKTLTAFFKKTDNIRKQGVRIL